jgi:ABC-type lipoprotein release transport system permease subunit
VSAISFPLKDLARRKTQTRLTILGLTIATATTVFLVLFTSNLGFEISDIAKTGKLTSGFTNIFSQFIMITSVLNLVISPVIISFLVHLKMASRMKDIAIMKTCGCLTKSIFGYFATEISLIIFASTALGAILGVTAFYITTFVMNLVGFHFQQTFNFGAILVIFVITIISSHIFGVRPIVKASKVTPTEAMSPIHGLGITNFARKISSKFGFTLKIAFRNVIRRKTTTIQVSICIVTVLTLTTVTLLGGMIANQTSINYSEKAIGKNVILIGCPTVTERYVKLLNKFFQEDTTEPIDYTSSETLISESTITKLKQIEEITKVDPRLILEHSVREVPGIILDPVDQTGAIIIGNTS